MTNINEKDEPHHLFVITEHAWFNGFGQIALAGQIFTAVL